MSRPIESLIYTEARSARPVFAKTAGNEISVGLLHFSLLLSSSMDSYFVILVFLFGFSLANENRTLKFVTVVSMRLSIEDCCRVVFI